MSWLIESGEYSDYEVHAVAETEEIAKAVCDRLNALGDTPGSDYGGYRYHEVPSVTSSDDVRPVVFRHVHLIYDRNKRVCTVSRTMPINDIWLCGESLDGRDEQITEWDVDWQDRQEHQISVTLADVTEEHALKVASERMAKWRSEHELDPQP